MTLRDLDDRVLPGIARGVRRVNGRVDRVRERVRPVLEDVRTDPVEVARRRPHAAVAGAVVLVLLLGVGAALSRSGQHSAPAPTSEHSRFAVVGPHRGQQVSDYRHAAAGRLAQLARTHPNTPVLAVVDLRRYLDPAGVRRLTAGLPVLRAYVHVRLPQGDTPVHVVTLSGIDDLAGEVARTGRVSAQAAVGYGQLLAALGKPGDARQQELHDVYVTRRDTARAEAARLTPRCPCVFGLVVRATADRLQRLADSDQVRVVDPAPREVTLTGLAALALLPETTGAVPADQGFA